MNSYCYIFTGLNTGYIVKIYLDNPFPAYLVKIEGSVRCLDISSLKEKLAVVSDHEVLSVFDLYSEEKIQEFQNVNSVTFNSHFEDIMYFSSGEYLTIKVNDFTEYRQKFSGLVMGHNESKVYCLNGSSIVTMEVNYNTLIISNITICHTCNNN